MADITTRTSPTTGKTTYQVRIRRSGFPTLTKTFKTKAEAEHWSRTQETSLLEGSPILTKEKERFTFAFAIEEYEKYKGFRSQTEAYRLNNLKEDFGDLAIINLTAKRLSAYLQMLGSTNVPEPHNRKKAHPLYQGHIERKYSKSTIRKIYFSIKKIYEWHSGFRNYPINNIFKVVPAPVDDGERDRRLRDGEEEKILQAIDTLYKNKDELRTLFLVSLETAMRLGEQLKITWSEVDFKNRSIRIHKDKTKTKKYREVPMTSVCIKLLEDHKKTKNEKDDRVFWQWNTSHALYQRFKIVLKNANIEDYRWHDNRHEAVSRMFERTNLRDIEIAKISGHTNMSTLSRYANLRTSDLADRMW